MGILSMANMFGSFCLGNLSDKFGRKRVVALSAFPAALAAFILFYWLRAPLAIAVGIAIFGTVKASVPALVVALAQETAPPGNAGTASGIIMSLHYFAGVVAPLIAAQIIAGTGNIVLAMILTTVSSVDSLWLPDRRRARASAVGYYSPRRHEPHKKAKRRGKDFSPLHALRRGGRMNRQFNDLKPPKRFERAPRLTV